MNGISEPVSNNRYRLLNYSKVNFSYLQNREGSVWNKV